MKPTANITVNVKDRISPSEAKKKARVFAFTTFIQHCCGDSSH